VHLYGDLHRFIPALASYNGARVAEVPIQNTARVAGASHYGLSRTFRVLFDILTSAPAPVLHAAHALLRRVGLMGRRRRGDSDVLPDREALRQLDIFRSTDR